MQYILGRWFSSLNNKNQLLYECCRLSHFDYVKSEDLERIGMGKPAIRRLVDVVKKRSRKKSLFDKVSDFFAVSYLKFVVHKQCGILSCCIWHKILGKMQFCIQSVKCYALDFLKVSFCRSIFSWSNCVHLNWYLYLAVSSNWIICRQHHL